MDFEDQLEKAEKLASPSLVGSSIRSADDSAHNNYIHPEKYTSSTDKKKKKSKRTSILNSSIGASLDDLMSEGALLGSDEDFTKFLDDQGNIKDDAKLEKNIDSSPLKEEVRKQPSEDAAEPSVTDPVIPEPESSSVNVNEESVSSGHTSGSVVAATLGSGNDYSTPNLSEYQLDNQIKDHKDLLDNVKSYDLNRLPSSDDREVSKSNALFAKDSLPVKSVSTHNRSIDSTSSLVDAGKNINFLRNEPDLHTPYFYSDSTPARPSSRSRSRSAIRNSRSQSSSKPKPIPPHLARGDSYKNVHAEEPSTYELPPDLDDDRRSRQSKPTFADITAAEEEKAAAVAAFHSESLTRDPSLVTTGDYTNFNVDTPRVTDTSFAARSLSSTNYLRSISRSRSRQPKQLDRNDAISQGGINEKNDANPDELAKEGALINEDPYSSINGLDTMVENVLHIGDEKKKSNDEELQKKKPNDEELQKKKPNDSIEEEKESNDVKTQTTSVIKPESLDKKELKHEEKEIDVKDEALDEEIEPKKEIEPETESKKEVESVKETDPKKELEEEETEPKKELEEEEIEPEKEVEPIESLDEEEKAGSKKVSLLPDEATPVTEPETEEAEPEAKEEKTEDEEPSTLIAEAGEPAAPEEIEEIAQTEPKAENAEKELEAESKEPEEEAEEKPESKTGEKPEAVSETKAESETKEIEPVAVSKEIEPATVSKESEAEAESKEEPAVSKTIAEPAEPEAKAVSESDLDDIDFENISPEDIRKHLESLPIYLFTSFAGGMQIIPRTNRLATILQANGIKFEYRDLGTDDEAKKIWKRSSNGKTLPGIVRGDDFIGNWQEIDEANEEYKLKELLYETL